jgi:hypothetical protein
MLSDPIPDALVAALASCVTSPRHYTDGTSIVMIVPGAHKAWAGQLFEGELFVAALPSPATLPNGQLHPDAVRQLNEMLYLVDFEEDLSARQREALVRAGERRARFDARLPHNQPLAVG